MSTIYVLITETPHEGAVVYGAYSQEALAEEAIWEMDHWSRPDAEVIPLALDAEPRSHYERRFGP